MSLEVTPEQFVEAARALGMRVASVPRMASNEPPGVNVWADEDVRGPATTIWWPRPDHPQDAIAWGPNFEHSAHRDIPAETLAQQVKETL